MALLTRDFLQVRAQGMAPGAAEAAALPGILCSHGALVCQATGRRVSGAKGISIHCLQRVGSAELAWGLPTNFDGLKVLLGSTLASIWRV